MGVERHRPVDGCCRPGWRAPFAPWQCPQGHLRRPAWPRRDRARQGLRLTLRHKRLRRLPCRTRFGVTVDPPIHIHAVHHFTHGVLEADGVLFKLLQLVIKVLREHITLAHIMPDRSQIHRVHSLQVKFAFMLVSRQLRRSTPAGILYSGMPVSMVRASMALIRHSMVDHTVSERNRK